VAEGVALDIRGPERIALLGANGAGKSTLLRIIGGQQPPDSGTAVRAQGRVAYLSQRLDLPTLACVLFAEPAPQLLLLDEPTNKLDLVGVGRLETALTAYQGAFMVVSHDDGFLGEIKVDRWLRLADGRITEARAPR
jgi:ATPase subunit of ABC transporter with duplicated ATPase domains